MNLLRVGVREWPTIHRMASEFCCLTGAEEFDFQIRIFVAMAVTAKRVAAIGF